MSEIFNGYNEQSSLRQFFIKCKFMAFQYSIYLNNFTLHCDDCYININKETLYNTHLGEVFKE
jgi:hypothetical protein